ncbi:MAG: TraR/DksA C4-type zinc finger protein [Puniceicoccales bacterium]|jgi:RNA polymerase-binding transcription factor DksA|nr:TraR/DksA C4-type zinc finger protein [Puniceicoccales bacterium]
MSLHMITSHLKKNLHRDTVSGILRRRKQVQEYRSHRDLLVFTMEDVRAAIAEAQQLDSEAGEESRFMPKVPANVPPPAPPAVRAKVVAAAGIAELLGFNPQMNSALSSSGKEKEVPEAFRKHYERLFALKQKLQGQEPVEPIDDFDMDFALSLMEDETEVLKEIDRAIGRIFEGTYGRCEITGKPIAAERLLAIPFTRYSLEGKDEKERQDARLQRVHVTESISSGDLEESALFDEEEEAEV